MARKKKEEKKVDFDLISSLKAEYKNNVIDPNQEIKRIKTGSPMLNFNLNGGLPLGRIIEFFGEEGSGKTVIALSAIADAQRQGKVCAIIDMEGSIDLHYLNFVGIDINNLLLLNLESAEKVFDTMCDLFEKGVDIIGLDSISSMPSEAELENEISKEQVGLLARIISKALRKINPTYCVAKGKTVILINQTRVDIKKTMGDPNTATGGKAIRFYASLRIRVNGKKEAGVKHASCTTIKSRVSPIGKTCMVLINDNGINAELDILNMAMESGIITRKGAFYEFEGNKIQGKENVINEMKTNKEYKDAIIKAGMFEDYVV